MKKARVHAPSKSFFRHLFVVSFVLGLAFLSVLFMEPGGPVRAEKKTTYITIDRGELKTVARYLPGLKYEIIGGDREIAVVRLEERDLAGISLQMHERFNKCAGFIAHPTEAGAVASLLESQAEAPQGLLNGYTIDNAAHVLPLLPEAREPDIRQTIIDLSAYHTRRHDQPTGLESAAYIKQRWETLAAGRADITVEYFNHPANVTPQPSVVLSIEGATTPNEIVVLGGHQDSIRSGQPTGHAPGADDNASGIAVLTEIIRVLVEKDYRPARTVRFMAYAAEEVGLRGSNDIAVNYKNEGLDVRGVVQFDMTNYQGSPTYDFAFESDTRFINTAQTQFMKDLIDEYLPELSYTDSQCNYGCSDHVSWHNQGFPASFPFEAPFGQHNTALHTGDDTIARSGDMADHALKFAKLGLTFVGELAKGTIGPAASGRVRFDLDGDRRTDVSVFRPGPGEWWFLRSSDGENRAFQFGGPDDWPMPADLTGDGRTDIAFWRESAGEIYVLRSEDATYYSFPFGTPGDLPAPGDFDGDGVDDPALFRPADGLWFIIRSTDAQTEIRRFGLAGDRPAVEDYDGDGTDDIAIYRPSNSQWWLDRSAEGVIAYQFGTGGDLTVPGDWTGDGRADIAVWRPPTGEWFVLRSEDASYYSFPFGTADDIPVPGEYDGDGRTDAAVFRPADGVWYKLQSANGFETVPFGAGGDFPLPYSYVAR